jgi:membrane protein involved in colicin uptake
MPTLRRTAKLTERPVAVLKRAEIKRASSSGYAVNPGDIICLVKGESGNVHTTTLRRNKKHTCTCEGNARWHRQCYHIKAMVKAENARWEAERNHEASVAAHQAERAEADRIAAEAKVIEEARQVAATELAKAGEVVAEAAVATRAKKIRRGIATKRAEDEAAVSKVVVTLSEVREAKQAAKVSKKSTEQAMLDAPLTRNAGFSFMR